MKWKQGWQRDQMWMTCLHPLNPGLPKANSKLGQKNVLSCLIQLGLGLLFLATKRFPNDTSGKQARPSLCSYRGQPNGEGDAEQRVTNVIGVTSKVKCRGLKDCTRWRGRSGVGSEKAPW